MPPLTPSASTTLSLLSGSVTAILVWALSLKGITMPAGIEAAVTAVIAAAVGYIPKSGRSRPLDAKTRSTDFPPSPPPKQETPQ